MTMVQRRLHLSPAQRIFAAAAKARGLDAPSDGTQPIGAAARRILAAAAKARGLDAPSDGTQPIGAAARRILAAAANAQPGSGA